MIWANMSEQRRTALERAATSIATTVIAAAMIWGAATLADLVSRVSVVQVQIAEMRARQEGIYTSDQAEEDLGRVHRRIEDHETRIRRLEAP